LTTYAGNSIKGYLIYGRIEMKVKTAKRFMQRNRWKIAKQSVFGKVSKKNLRQLKIVTKVFNEHAKSLL